MNKKTLALTTEQYNEIIDTMRIGFSGCRPNDKIATILMLQANLGLRIGDILQLRMKDIVKDGNRYRLDIIEEKTEKARTFTVTDEIVQYLQDYCLENSIKKNQIIFPITERAVQKHLKTVCDYLGLDGVSTHSFRKFFATEIYKNNDYNVVLVQKLLQHSSPLTTQRYIGISSKEVEDALMKHSCIR